MMVSMTPALPAVPASTAKVSPARDSADVKPVSANTPAELTVREQLRQQGNAAIMQANQQVSLQTGNESLALLYTAAIDAINQKLAPSLGENALQRGLDEGLDVSPEATAKRIVSLTTGMFSRYQDSNPELDFSAQVEHFVDIISGGIEQGFAEARGILEGLEVLEGDIATNIDATYALVQQGLKAFTERQLATQSAL